MSYFSAASASTEVAFEPHLSLLHWSWWSWCSPPLLPVAGSHLQKTGTVRDLEKARSSYKPQRQCMLGGSLHRPRLTVSLLVAEGSWDVCCLPTIFFLCPFIKMESRWDFATHTHLQMTTQHRHSHGKFPFLSNLWLPRCLPKLSFPPERTYLCCVGEIEEWCSRFQLIYNQ